MIQVSSVHVFRVFHFDEVAIIALRVCEAFISSPPPIEGIQNTPRPFVYISAEDIFRPIVPSGYIEAKRAAEQGIQALMANQPNYRGVYIRPSVFHLVKRLLCTPH